ncbi:MAG: 16S rRNA (cytosine1402-N4)-methyltransferase [Flavobacteriales bacterium]|jgi:16S rRNA (cytosine1402-N4)-methyltransferase
MTEQAYHIPVLLGPSIDGLNIKPDGIYIDVTFGGGGHAKEILKQLTTGKLYGLDQDPRAMQNAPDDKNFEFIQGNFRYVSNFLIAQGITQVDGLLADLGVSSHQFDDANRGFSLRFEGELDMRMNSNGKVTAKDILNTYEESQLARIFKMYGELPHAKKVAKFIVRYRDENDLNTTTELREAIEHLAPRTAVNKFLAQVFQAVRIEVNSELEVLEEFLGQMTGLIKPGGRLVVISYHSLEDRLVKNFVRSGNLEGNIEKDFFGNIIRPFESVTRKAIQADINEKEQNNRARSARLRIAERNNGD